MTVNGWHLLGHPVFIAQFEKLVSAVHRAQAKDPDGYFATSNAKLLTVLSRLVFETIPQDPSRPEYRQGGTLGKNRKHWFRAKFGSGRFRLFFRYQQASRIIVYAWVNDQDTLRTYGAKNDAYAVFRSMLERDSPPDAWSALVSEAIDVGLPDERFLGTPSRGSE